jgi:hypothetical protein
MAVHFNNFLRTTEMEMNGWFLITHRMMMCSCKVELVEIAEEPLLIN